jgi:hypothetical protein
MMTMKPSILCAGVLLPCIIAAALLAADQYTINVSTDGSGVISYDHRDSKGMKTSKGENGHHFVKTGDTVTWQCGKDTKKCSFVAVKFKGTAPCTLSGNTCMVTDSSAIALYPYSIAVSTPSGVAVDDPDIIVDNNSIGTLGGKNSKKK